ncbi:vesicle-associated membrane protein 4 isoform X2 [Narcine bancroftii]|uniref:vesicle-associated membrane protein 4 isoform X2 n=1 Tax=Narcine bancroftii TaxID=1343680 RepID=UPI003831E631
MPPKFKRHLDDDDVTGSIRSERRNLLEDDSDEEEDFFLRGPAGPKFGPKNDKIKHVQNQVDEVIDVMQENITRVIERGERLDELQDKSGKWHRVQGGKANKYSRIPITWKSSNRQKKLRK